MSQRAEVMAQIALRSLVFVLCGGGLITCSTASSGWGGFYQSGTLKLAAMPQQTPAWTIEPGDGVVLVMYRSAGSSHATADNEELVVQLTPAELAAGTATMDGGGERVARYQRGGSKLEYASTTVKGSLQARRDGERVKGQVSITASAPVVNVTGRTDDVTRQLSFDLDPR